MLFALSMTILYIAFWFALHFGIGTLIPALPEKLRRKWFNCEKPLFRVSSREMNFFRRIRLPKWKDRLPQNGHGFDKRHLPGKINADYLKKFIFITCQAEVIHYLIAVFGFLSLFFCFCFRKPRKKIPLLFSAAVLLGLCNFPFAMIQRYNRFRLEKTLEKFPQGKVLEKQEQGESSLK